MTDDQTTAHDHHDHAGHAHTHDHTGHDHAGHDHGDDDDGIRVESKAPRLTIEVSPEALEQIVALRDQEDQPDKLGLGLRIAGVGTEGFRYETAFVLLDDVDDDQLIEQHGPLPVVIPRSQLQDLRGSTLAMSSDAGYGGLVIRNPNPATPGLIEVGDLELTGTVAEKVEEILERQINPAIAMHGGFTSLAGVDEDNRVFLQLGGGCQGCGLAAITLREGIESALRQAIPEITEIVDVTNHAAGENPFYEASAK